MDSPLLYEPVRPWPVEYTKLGSREAIAVIVTGSHRDAYVYGQDPGTDSRLIALIEKNLATCALNIDGTLITQATCLALMRICN